MDPIPPAHEPAHRLGDQLDDLVAGLHRAGLHREGFACDDEGPPPDLPEVVEAVTGRARDLHRLADRLSAGNGEPGAGDTLSAVALLRAHAGAVDDLAEHLQSAGSADGGPGHTDEPGPAGRGPRGVG